MMITMKRLLWLIGFSSLLGFATWQLYNGAFQGELKHQRAFSMLFGEQNASSTSPSIHHEVYSASTSNGEYFLVEFGDNLTYNPNILPHITLDDTYVVVAQGTPNLLIFSEVVCNARFENDKLVCVDEVAKLPVAATHGGNCEGDLVFLNWGEGPHDARVFNGPTISYTIFGSNSAFTCFGQWIQDFRVLMEWDHQDLNNEDFTQATELQRPTPYGNMEKNWFLFWDESNNMYVHNDIYPERVFANLEPDGSVGPDLAIEARAADKLCMDKFMPKVGPMFESIHQASNSLKITMCKRSDQTCIPDDTNTFIFTIFQHKTYFNFHSVYEPYVMLFKQTAPFSIHAISAVPFWIRGRRKGQSPSDRERDDRSSDSESTLEQDEMFYVTSMSWKVRDQKYHGYLDDLVLISFGIEDKKSAGIDVVVGDLLSYLGTC